jgi:hypothetical protein
MICPLEEILPARRGENWLVVALDEQKEAFQIVTRERE